MVFMCQIEVQFQSLLQCVIDTLLVYYGYFCSSLHK